MLDCEKAVWILKTKGPQPLSVVAEALGITTEGARFQLLKLAGEGVVQADTVAKGRGRPQQIWSLTDAGHARFPDTHAELTVKLINMMRDTLGEEAVQQVIKAHEKSNTAKYQRDVNPHLTLEDKIKQLARIRDSEGYMAEYVKDQEGFLLIENHCPICAAAQTCQGFCASELSTFKTVLGKTVSVKRVDHILGGARRCAYRITEE